MTAGHPEIKPAFATRNIPVVFSTDTNYLPYVKVAINSVIAHSAGCNLDIIVLHSGVGADVIQAFAAQYAELANVSVRFADVSERVGASTLADFKHVDRLPVSTCFRLLLPEILPAYDKVIYLDVDVAVCRNLGDLYATDISDCYFAAAKDVVHTIKPEYLSWAADWGFTEWDGYVNAGVLVMNLERFRREPVIDRLLAVAVDASKYLCDQDALNFVCKGAIAPLDPRWNVQLGDYCLKKQLALTGDEMWVAHFTSKQKPWSLPARRYSHRWWCYVSYEDGIQLWRKAFGDRPQVSIGDGIATSVIIPIYNTKPYLSQTLLSYCAQTLSNIEIICVDDGSTDGSREICETFALADPRIKVISQKNQGAAIARNRGIDEARGSWLFFGDSDDFCRPEMLEEMVRAGQTGCHDVVVAGRMIIDCGRSTQIREVMVPEGYFGRGQNANCHTDGINVFAGLGFAPWNKLFRRAFVVEKGIKFHNNPSCDDAFFVFSSLIAAESISFVDKSCYYYRSNLPTSQMGLADKNPTNFLVALREVKCLLDGESLRLKEQFYNAAVHSCFDHLFARKTSEGRRVTFAALQNGGLESLRFPQIDSRTFDLGSMRRVFDLTVSGGSLADVLAEHCQANDAKVADLMDGLAATHASALEKSIARYEKWLAEEKAKVVKRDEWLANEKAKVAKRDERVSELKAQLEQKQQAVVQRDEWLAAEKERVAKRDERVSALQAQLEQKQQAVAQRDEWLAAEKERVARRDERVSALQTQLEQKQQAVAQRDEWLANEKAKVAKRDERVSALQTQLEQKQQAVAQRDEWLAAEKERVARRDKRVSALQTQLEQKQQAVAQRDEWLAAEKERVARRDERMSVLQAQLGRKQQAVVQRDKWLAVEKAKVAKRDEWLAAEKEKVAKRNEWLANEKEKAAKTSIRISALQTQLEKQQKTIADRDTMLAKCHKSLAAQSSQLHMLEATFHKLTQIVENEA